MGSNGTMELVSIGLLLLIAYCIAIFRQDMQASVPSRHSQCVALYTQKSDCRKDNRFLCHDVLDHRTFIDDYFKILDFIEWLKEYYPEKATFLNKEIRL